MTKVRKELRGFSQDIVLLAAVLLVPLVAWKVLMYLLGLVTTLVMTAIAIVGTVFMAALFIWALTEMQLRTSKRGETQTEGK